MGNKMNLLQIPMERLTKYPQYDAIVIGSGISGGWAAKELCERGLKTLLLERGRPISHPTDYPTAMMDPWDFPSGLKPTAADRRADPIQSTSYDAGNKHFYVSDKEHPYIQITPFHWIRGYQLGGKSLIWGRQCYRWSDLDFEANLKEGVAIDWPIRYRDLAPWYDYVESFVGVSGRRDGLAQLPDGHYLPPFGLNCIEQHLAETFTTHYGSERLLTIARVANATKPTTMRSIRAAFDDSSDVIDAVISGPPPTAETGPRIYLAGPAPAAARAYDLFISAGLTTTNLGERLGAASALKMATASYLRTTRLLAALAHGLADAHGVTDALIAEAHELGAKPLADRSYLPSVAARAWRWQQEMVDVADTLTDADLPAGLAAASAQLFEYLAAEKDSFSIAPEAVIARLRTPTTPD